MVLLASNCLPLLYLLNPFPIQRNQATGGVRHCYLEVHEMAQWLFTGRAVNEHRRDGGLGIARLYPTVVLLLVVPYHRLIMATIQRLSIRTSVVASNLINRIRLMASHNGNVPTMMTGGFKSLSSAPEWLIQRWRPEATSDAASPLVGPGFSIHVMNLSYTQYIDRFTDR